MNQESKNELIQPVSEKLPSLLFLYAFGYAFFHILPAFLNLEIENRLMVGDVFDLLTPFAMIFLIYMLYRTLNRAPRSNSSKFPGLQSKLILLLGAIIFVEGHGIHLSSNAIARHLEETPDNPVYRLTYFFDEMLSHKLWDGGIVILSLGLILSSFSIVQKKAAFSSAVWIGLGALLYGFTYFANAVEGQTVIITFPIAILIPMLLWWKAHRDGIFAVKNPVLSFFLYGYAVAIIFFLIWLIWQGGFPEFSELGWI